MLGKIIKTGLCVCLASTLLNAATMTKGKILETKNAAGYTYMKLQTESETVWAAVPRGDYKVGTTISIKEQMRANQFKSKSLNTTFDILVFGTTNVAKKAHHTSPLAKKITPIQPDKKVTYKEDGIKTTIDKLQSTPKEFNEKLIQVEGKITKISRHIMNSHWVHVEDANGKKIIFRSLEDNVSEGQKVIAKGIAKANVDYGYGYKYDIIIVDSVFKAN